MATALDSVGVRLSGVVLLRVGEAEARLGHAGRWRATACEHPRQRAKAPSHGYLRCEEVARTPRDGRAPSGAAEIPAHGRARPERRSRCYSLGPPPSSRRRQLTEEHRKKPKDPGRGGQLLFLGDFCTGPEAGCPAREAAGTRPGRTGLYLAGRRTEAARPARGADQALLHDGHHQLALVGEDLARGPGPGRPPRSVIPGRTAASGRRGTAGETTSRDPGWPRWSGRRPRTGRAGAARSRAGSGPRRRSSGRRAAAGRRAVRRWPAARPGCARSPRPAPRSAPADRRSAGRSDCRRRTRDRAGGMRLGGRHLGHGDACYRPGSGWWNDAESVKIVLPCWMADTRRVVKDRPSRTRSTR